ncbi:peptidyl-prolyl cis-trans isomerase, partial [bacterium]|nr:peptidyl-prolyl cis-trans isomerase [bacterium]
MRRLAAVTLLFAVVALLAGCAGPGEKPVVTLTDQNGVIESHVVTVDYVNERMEHMPPMLLPGIGGDEGKLAFLDEIIRKELLVIGGYRIGMDQDPRLAGMLEHLTTTKSEDMLRQDLIAEPSQVTPDEVEKYYETRDVLFQMREIILRDEAVAQEAYRRVTEGGEDFAEVARELSVANTATDGGRRDKIDTWQDLHPLVRAGIRYLEKDEICEPINVSDTYHIYLVLSRKTPATREPLVDKHLAGITMEARAFKRDLTQFYVIDAWMSEADITYNEEAVELAGVRIEERILEVIPPTDEVIDTDKAIERAQAHIVPDFTEEEAQMEFTRFRVGGQEHIWTLGEYARILTESPGIETPKSGTRIYVTDSVLKRVFEMIKDYEKEKRGYLTSREMQDYLADRFEEGIVDLTYNAEVVQRTEAPSGQEVREYFRSHREDFVRPPRADVQQILVGTEAEANLILQRIREGEADFAEMVQKHSIDDWSKTKDGVITDIIQGEGRLAYIQEPSFSVEIGQISDPVRAPGGYALVKVLARYPEEQLDFSEVGDTVMSTIVGQQREAALMAFLDDVRASVDIEIHEGNLQYVSDPLDVY